MQTAVAILILFAALFIIWANPKEKFNRWCFASLCVFCLGVFNGALVDEVFPAFFLPHMERRYLPLSNTFEWMLYTLPMPILTIAGFYFGYAQYGSNWVSKNWETLKYTLFIPGIVLAFIFSPLRTHEYQETSLSFWVSYTAYNLSFGAVLLVLIIKGVLFERKLIKEKSILKKERNRRLQDAIALFPPIYLSLFSVVPVRLISFIGLDRFDFLMEIWQINFVVIPLCIISAVFFAIKGGGWLGVRIIPTRYSFILTNDVLMTNFAHRMKSQTGLMFYDIDQLRKSLHSGQDFVIINREIENYLEKLFHKIRNINDISSKINRYSSTIRFHQLDIKNWRLIDLINEAFVFDMGIRVSIDVDEGVHLNCEKALMIEVFKDIIDNAVQSIQAKPLPGNGEITITAERSCEKCVIRFEDNGIGIAPDRIHTIFIPGESTKNKDYNTGMGLANSKKIVNAHGGNIFADSQGDGKGATIVIKMP